ncbi:MAG TPA: YCF48-related protein [Rhizobacter sp.]|nr:YCF48-related protein [Rhizobacter sp.]
MVATAASPDTRWRDVLDTPATPSALAPRALLNGLARAGQRVVAVGQRGHVLYSNDAGQRWEQAQVPVSSDLVAVSFADANNGWAVGHDGVVLHTSDGGLHWELQLDGRRIGALMLEYYTREAAAVASSPERAAALLEEAKRFASQGADNPLLDVWFRDASNGFVVGAFGLALRTRDGGKSWQPMLHAIDNPKGMHLYAVRGIGPDLYIVGEQGLAFKLEQYVERAAERFTTLELPYKGTLFGVVGNERALVVHGLRGSALRSTDAGRSWQTLTTGLQVGMTASAIDAQGRFMLVSQAGHLLVSSDDGATFNAARLERPVPAAAVIEAAPGALVVAGPRGAQALALP